MISKNKQSIPTKELRFLIRHLDVSKNDIDYFSINPIKDFTPNQMKKLDIWIKRRENGEPLTKIVGVKSFYNHEFFVNEHVLDPRQESETLIDLFIKTFNDFNLNFTLWDLGTGSGCLLLSILDLYKNSRGFGIDISERALQVAIINAKNLDLHQRVTFMKNSWLSGIKTLGNGMNIIISNPPYIGIDEKIDDSAKYDPPMALFSDNNGMSDYIKILNQLKELNCEFEIGFFEIGFDKSLIVQNLIKANNFQVIKICKDLSGIDRAISFRKK